MISSLTSFVESFGIAPAPAGIVTVLSFLVVVGLVASLYQEVRLRRAEQRRRWPRATSEVDEDDPAART
jgi:uncharacterized membrane protein YtjA (UPF0391 family)